MIDSRTTPKPEHRMRKKEALSVTMEELTGLEPYKPMLDETGSDTVTVLYTQ